MDTYNLVVGEVVSIDKLTDSDGNTLKCTIVGIFEPSDESDIYWKETPADFDKMMFTDKASFDEMIRKYNILTVYYTEFWICLIMHISIIQMQRIFVIT